jgi:DNA-binding CsgD family transcriptional regulator
MSSKKIAVPAALFDFLCAESSDLLFVIDEAFRVRESGAIARKLLGLPGGGRGFIFTDLLSESDASAFAAAFAGASADDTISDATVTFHLPADRIMRARLSLIRIPGGSEGNGHTLVFARPIEHLDPLRFDPLVARILSGYMEPVFIVDAELLTIRDCNKAAETLFSAHRDELIGKPLATIAEGGAFEEKLLREARLALQSSGVFRTKIALRRSDGLSLRCTTTAIGLFDEASHMAGLLYVVHDRSEDEAQKAEIRRAAESILLLAKELASCTSAFEDSRKAPHLSEFGLSERQIEVARRITAGATSKSVAMDLAITEATVKSHLSTIFKKLGVRSRAELINFIHERKLQFD